MRILLTLLFLTSPLTAHADLWNGLVGWWKFNEASGNAIDSSDQGNTGTPTGTTIQPSIICPRSGCRQFNGTTDIIQVTAASNINNLGPVTYSQWVYPLSGGEGNSGTIVNKRATAGATGFTLATNANLGLGFSRTTSATAINVISSNNVLLLNKWNYVTCTWDGSLTATNVHIYVNNVETGYTTQTNGTGAVNDDSGNTFKIGNNFATSATWDGLIDEVRVYNRVLTAQELTDLFNQVVKLPNATIANGNLNQ